MLAYDREKQIEAYQNLHLAELRDELARLQRECINENIPVILMVDGFESSHRGYLINELVKNLDTKHYKVKVFDDFHSDAEDYHYTLHFWQSIPAYGDFSIFYRSMYFTLFNDLKISPSRLATRIDLLREQEKLLADDHYIILKFFTDIDQKQQKKNIKALKKDSYTSFLVSKPDQKQSENYDAYRKHMDEILDATDFSFAPWQVIPVQHQKQAARMLLALVIVQIRERLAEIRKKKAEEQAFVFTSKRQESILAKLDMTKRLDDEAYHAQKDVLQKRAGEWAYRLFVHKIPTIIVFEGIDAAGKGGCIQRLVNEIDPRIYEINPISAPTDAELDHLYLLRFYNNMPKRGHMAIFDRSWYGRVLVERVEGFARDFDWSRAYEEINTMERRLVEQGALVLKYHLVISKEEQEARFRDRQAEKPYKITDEDWRNRDKWDQYIAAMDDMLAYTSSAHAPWQVFSSENKEYARIEVLKDFIRRAEAKLKKDG